MQVSGLIVISINAKLEMFFLPRLHVTWIYNKYFYVNRSSYMFAVSLTSLKPSSISVPDPCCPTKPTAEIINAAVEFFLFVCLCFCFFPVECSPACKWMCLWVDTSESGMRSWYKLAQSRRRSAEVSAAVNADRNSTFGTKLYCEALYQLNRWMTMGFN